MYVKYGQTSKADVREPSMSVPMPCQIIQIHKQITHTYYDNTCIYAPTKKYAHVYAHIPVYICLHVRTQISTLCIHLYIYKHV